MSWGVDVTTDYYFRGIFQENAGVIIQPYADVTIDLLETDQGDLTATLGIWNSFHEEQTGAGPGEGADFWYEADLFASFDLAISDSTSVGVIYTAYTSPNGAFSTVQEIGVYGSYGNSVEVAGIALDYEAHAGIYFEVDNGADGFEEGIYAEIGFTPSTPVTVFDTEVTMSLPMVIGLSVDDYYEQAEAGGGTDDDTVGYIQVGLFGEVPIDAIPDRYGEYSFAAGVTLLWLNDHTQDINSGQDHEVIGTIGISGTY
ncbi:MAG: hypothetical protein AAGD32_04235 [Planctomycetota bacterium]